MNPAKSALAAVLCLGAAFYLFGDFYWEWLIVTNGAVLLVKDAHSDFDFWFTAVCGVGMFVLGFGQLRRLWSMIRRR